jgi:flagellar assembly protein FliH
MDEMGKTVITPDNVTKHTIRPYNFRAIKSVNKTLTPTGEHEEEQKVPKPKNTTLEPTPHYEEFQQSPASIVLDKKLLEITESILKKAEDLEVNLKDVQDRLESQKEQFTKELDETKKANYDRGFQDGEAKAKSSMQESIDTIKEQFLNSITELNEAINDNKRIIDSFEKELSDVALDISKEVIISEITENSKEIALNLSKELISSLKDATKITIKLNPSDCEYVKTKLDEDKNIELSPSKAIAKGGVIVNSDVGNIDGNVMVRYNNIKRSIKEAQGS